MPRAGHSAAGWAASECRATSVVLQLLLVNGRVDESAKEAEIETREALLGEAFGADHKQNGGYSRRPAAEGKG